MCMTEPRNTRFFAENERETCFLSTLKILNILYTFLTVGSSIKHDFVGHIQRRHKDQNFHKIKFYMF